MAGNKGRVGERVEEWLIKLLKGVAGGLILSILMLIEGSLRGDGFWRTALYVLAIMFYGIGFSFGSIFIKLSWRKFRARAVGAGLFGYGTFLFVLLMLVAGVAVGWLVGWVFCVADIVCAVQGRRLLSSIIEARYGEREYEPADNLVEKSVRYHYEDHGTPDIRKPGDGKGFTPTEEQVQTATQKKKQEYGYFD